MMCVARLWEERCALLAKLDCYKPSGFNFVAGHSGQNIFLTHRLEAVLESAHQVEFPCRPDIKSCAAWREHGTNQHRYEHGTNQHRCSFSIIPGKVCKTDAHDNVQ